MNIAQCPLQQSAFEDPCSPDAELKPVHATLAQKANVSAIAYEACLELLRQRRRPKRRPVGVPHIQCEIGQRPHLLEDFLRNAPLAVDSVGLLSEERDEVAGRYDDLFTLVSVFGVFLIFASAHCLLTDDVYSSEGGASNRVIAARSPDQLVAESGNCVY